MLLIIVLVLVIRAMVNEQIASSECPLEMPVGFVMSGGHDMKWYMSKVAKLADWYSNMPLLRLLPGWRRYYAFIARNARNHPYRFFGVAVVSNVLGIVLVKNWERKVLAGPRNQVQL